MKHLRPVILILAVASLLVCIFSCGSKTKPPIDLVSEGYTLVYNGTSSDDVRFKTLLSSKLSREGINISSAKDTDASSEHEILLTNVAGRELASTIKGSYLSNVSEYIGAYAMRVSDGKLYLSASCVEAEAIIIDQLLSYKSGAGELSVPGDLDVFVYFDLAEYRESGAIETFKAADLMKMTDLVSITAGGEPFIELEKGKYNYDFGASGITDSSSFEGIELDIKTFHPEMSYSLSVTQNRITILVTARNGSTQKEYQIDLKQASEYDVPSEIVHRDGAKGVLTLTSDDADPRTADFFATEIVPKYSSFKVTIAMPTRDVAELELRGDMWLMDDDGKYIGLTYLKNSYNSSIPGSVFKKASSYPTMIDFWKKILDVSGGAIEIASHSHTHANCGTSDEANGKFPHGNVIKELHASAQILQDLLGQDTPVFVCPGGTIGMSSDYFNQLIQSDNTYIGMRKTSGDPPLPNATSPKLNTVNKFKTQSERYNIGTILVNSYTAAFNSNKTGFLPDTATRTQRLNAGVGAWTNYVDLAIKNGGWASIGFHSIVPDNTNASGYSVYDSQVIALMDYVQPLVDSGELWLGSFAEVTKYYFEWSSAELSTKVVNNTVEIRLTDGEEDERFDVALTVKVTIPYLWESALLSTGGVTTELEIHTDTDGTHFVYANVVPGDSVSTITPAN